MNDFERQWAVALKKGQMQNKQNQTTVPLDVWKKQVKEEMDYFKEELKKYIRVKNVDKTKETLEKLFSLRAEQIKIFYSEEEKQFGFVSETRLKKEIKRYYVDCAILVKTTERIIK